MVPPYISAYTFVVLHRESLYLIKVPAVMQICTEYRGIQTARHHIRAVHQMAVFFCLLARSLARRRRLLKIRCSTRGPVATPYFLLCGRRLRGKENERAGDLLLLTRPWQRRCDRDGRHFSPNSHPREPGLEAVSLSSGVSSSRLPSVCTSVTNGVLGAGAGEPSQQRLHNEVLATFIARVESTSLAGLISISGRDHRDGRKKGEKAKKESAVMVMAGFSCTHPPLHMRVLK